MSFEPCEASEPGPPGFWQTRVRNTFIEVEEEPSLALSGLDLHNAPGRTWRRGHLRCASEPMSFFLNQPGTQPPWEVSTIREEEASPKYVGVSEWCREPMLVDVRGEVPTLSLPVRLRHSRQRSRTIQEDSELEAQNLEKLQADVLSSNVNVRVRNTFIEVDDSDGCTDLLSAPWRPGHLRCASEPIPDYSRVHVHSRSSSYQEMEMAEILQAQASQALEPEDYAFLEKSQKREEKICKWHSRGMCKYGDSCRFSHRARPSPGPLPAGPVPCSSAPVPVGAVTQATSQVRISRDFTEAQKPKPAGLLQSPECEPHSLSIRYHCIYYPYVFFLCVLLFKL